MESGDVISEWSSERMTPGGGGSVGEDGNMSQYFEPVSTAFHALVALGSLWNVLPLRLGPMIIQRQSGRWSPSTLKRSSPKQVGGQYAASGAPRPIEMPVFSTKARSKRYSGLSSLLLDMYNMYFFIGQSTASARNLTSGYFSKSVLGVHAPYTGHSFTGEVRIKGKSVHFLAYSSYVRSGSLAIVFWAGMLVVKGSRGVLAH